ncbi:type VII secretion protein EccCa [Mycobacteroides abscessus]|uniref:type VII secretion protein EccCa n=1 Tax=Mycobacteroides abscessus TaxID=36809 RepID=UPI002104BC98|nr:type VII secretion protein EccCa [Mycobacteroides abscessus]
MPRREFTVRRRIVPPPLDESNFTVEAPPELPRAVPVNVLRKALPWVFGAVMVIAIIWMLASGWVARNPLMSLFALLMVAGMIGGNGYGGGNKTNMSTEEVDSERAEYLRYLTEVGNNIRAAAQKQRKSALWSHPDPRTELDPIVGSRRMWERALGNPDYLKVRIGLDTVKLKNRISVKSVDNEIDLEPVAKTALQEMRQVQSSIPHCPKAIDLAGCSFIGMYGDREMFRAATRAWISQLVTWHDPGLVKVAITCPELESQWDMAKWLPHASSAEIDGAGPARYLTTSYDKLRTILGKDLLAEREQINPADTGGTADGHLHVVVVVDDPDVSDKTLKTLSMFKGVTVIAYRQHSPEVDYTPAPREQLIRLDTNAYGTTVMEEWNSFTWKLFCQEPDQLDAQVARSLARKIAPWDVSSSAALDRGSAAAANFLSLMGIDNAAMLDLDTLWQPLPNEERLRIPLGLRENGEPLWIDLKDEAEGGMGPHGLAIGMTGSGKTTFLRTLMAGLLTKHSPDLVEAVLVDFKGEAGFDEFDGFPHVKAILSNMAEKKSMVDRFEDTLYGLMARRERHLKEWGHKVIGSAFPSVADYEAHREEAAAKDIILPPMPTMFIVIDEFSLMLADHPRMTPVLEALTRKGRTLAVFFLFASQTLDEGKIGKIPDNTQYKFCLKVAAASTSRRVIGTEDGFHIPPGKEYKGTSYFAKAPGATPDRYRGFYLDGIYEPPQVVIRKVTDAKPRARVFTADHVQPDAATTIETVIEAKTAIQGPPTSLIKTIKAQVKQYWTKPVENLWSPPLDDPIALNTLLDQMNAAEDKTNTNGRQTTRLAWPMGEIDQPRDLTHSMLMYDLERDGNISLTGGPKSGRTTTVQTFILSAAHRYSPRRIGFYGLSYGGPGLSALAGLPHVGAISNKDNPELTLRIFADLESIVSNRRRMFAANEVHTGAEYRRRRLAGEAALDDGYPIDIVLALDGYEGFLTDNTSQMYPKNPLSKTVERLAIEGPGLGVHVLVTASEWIVLGQTLNNEIKPTSVWELRLGAQASSQIRPPAGKEIMGRPNSSIPVDQPGRGINMAAEHIRFAVGRLDGKPSTEDLDEQIANTVQAVCAKHRGEQSMPKPKLLPLEVNSEKLLALKLGGERHAIGLKGRDLEPAVIDFAEYPLLTAYGDSPSGKTTLLLHLLRSVLQNRQNPDEIMVVVCDPRRKLMDDLQAAGFVEGKDTYETDGDQIGLRIMQIAEALQSRTPPPNATMEQRRNWKIQGAKIYLFIDDVDSIPIRATIPITYIKSNGDKEVRQEDKPTWAALLPYLSRARENGLRVIVAGPARGVAANEISPTTLLGKIAEQASNRIMLTSTSKTDKIGGLNFEDGLPPGRGRVVGNALSSDMHIQLAKAESVVPSGSELANS